MSDFPDQQGLTPMSPSEFERVGKGAFGNRWKAPLARDLHCSAITVWRYATGKTPIPYLVKRRMRELSTRSR